MVTMIVTKVVECSRLSVRMGQKKKTRMGWERKEGPPQCLCPVLAFNFLTLTCFFLFVPTDSVEKTQKVSHIHCDF